MNSRVIFSSEMVISLLYRQRVCLIKSVVLNLEELLLIGFESAQKYISFSRTNRAICIMFSTIGLIVINLSEYLM